MTIVTNCVALAHLFVLRVSPNQTLGVFSDDELVKGSKVALRGTYGLALEKLERGSATSDHV